MTGWERPRAMCRCRCWLCTPKMRKWHQLWKLIPLHYCHLAIFFMVLASGSQGGGIPNWRISDSLADGNSDGFSMFFSPQKESAWLTLSKDENFRRWDDARSYVQPMRGGFEPDGWPITWMVFKKVSSNALGGSACFSLLKLYLPKKERRRNRSHW